MLENLRIRSNMPEWAVDALNGRKLMRAGKDYVNTNQRYDKGYKLLKTAYRNASKDAATSPGDLARICLWAGICLNENNNIVPPKRRNDRAIAWYKKALQYVQQATHDHSVIPIKASLYNSLGVAYHHRLIGKEGWPIPAKSYEYYRKARDIVREFGEEPLHKKYLSRLMRKVKSNSGHRILLSGDRMHGGSDSYAYTVLSTNYP